MNASDVKHSPQILTAYGSSDEGWRSCGSVVSSRSPSPSLTPYVPPILGLIVTDHLKTNKIRARGASKAGTDTPSLKRRKIDSSGSRRSDRIKKREEGGADGYKLLNPDDVEAAVLWLFDNKRPLSEPKNLHPIIGSSRKLTLEQANQIVANEALKATIVADMADIYANLKNLCFLRKLSNKWTLLEVSDKLTPLFQKYLK